MSSTLSVRDIHSHSSRTSPAHANRREFNESLQVDIQGGEVAVELGQSVTLSGTLHGAAQDAICAWYVNGVPVGYGIRDIIIAGDVAGSYRVDLLVVTPDASDGGLATTWVRMVSPAPT